MVFSKKFACGAKLVVFYSKFSPAAQNQWCFAKKFRLRRKISCFYSELLIFTIFARKSKFFSLGRSGPLTIFELPPCLLMGICRVVYELFISYDQIEFIISLSVKTVKIGTLQQRCCCNYYFLQTNAYFRSWNIKYDVCGNLILLI